LLSITKPTKFFGWSIFNILLCFSKFRFVYERFNIGFIMCVFLFRLTYSNSETTFKNEFRHCLGQIDAFISAPSPSKNNFFKPTCHHRRRVRRHHHLHHHESSPIITVAGSCQQPVNIKAWHIPTAVYTEQYLLMMSSKPTRNM
jgi:hypothetical protein